MRTLGILTRETKPQVTPFEGTQGMSHADYVRAVYRVLLEREPSSVELSETVKRLELDANGIVYGRFNWLQQMIVSGEHSNLLSAAGIGNPPYMVLPDGRRIQNEPQYWYPGSGGIAYFNWAPPDPRLQTAAPPPAPTTPATTPDPVVQESTSTLPGQGTTTSYDLTQSQTSTPTTQTPSGTQRTTSTGTSSTVITLPGSSFTPAGSSAIVSTTSAVDRAKSWVTEQPWYVLAGIAAAAYFAFARKRR
jgi:hypothetical protein